MQTDAYEQQSQDDYSGDENVQGIFDCDNDSDGIEWTYGRLFYLANCPKKSVTIFDSNQSGSLFLTL